MSMHSFDQAVPSAHGIRGPQGWTFGSDFIGGEWFSLFSAITETGDASAPNANNINAEEKNGILLITTGSGDNEDIMFQTGGETVKMEAGEDYWFVCRVNSVVETTDIGYSFGLGGYDNATDMLSANKVVDGVYFQTLGDGTDIDFVTEAGGTQVVTSGVATIAADTFFKLSWLIEMSGTAGEGLIKAFVDDVPVHESYSVVLPTEAIGPYMYVENEQSGGARTVEVDYFFCGGDR